MNVLAILLLVGVAAGIAWPFLAGKRGLVRRRGEVALESAGVVGDGAAVTTAEIPVRTGHREQLCPQCGKVNPAQRRLCVDCNGELPFQDVKEGITALWQGKDREELVREGIQMGGLLVVLLIAVAISSFLSPAGKILVMLGALSAMLFRMWHKITDD
jgi:hypothetical protein